MSLAVAAILGFVSVAFGAYTEHSLRDQLSEGMFRYLMTAIRYNQVHAVASLAVGLAVLARIGASKRLLTYSGWASSSVRRYSAEASTWPRFSMSLLSPC